MILLLQRKRKGFDKKALVKFKLDNSHFFITENGDFQKDFEEKYVFLEGPLASDHSIQEKVRLLELQKLENELTNNIHLC